MSGTRSGVAKRVMDEEPRVAVIIHTLLRPLVKFSCK